MNYPHELVSVPCEQPDMVRILERLKSLSIMSDENMMQLECILRNIKPSCMHEETPLNNTISKNTEGLIECYNKELSEIESNIMKASEFINKLRNIIG